MHPSWPAAIDSHVHINSLPCLAYMKDYADHFGFQAVNVACLGQEKPWDVTQNMLALLLKHQDPRFYAHGALLYPSVPVQKAGLDSSFFAGQARELEVLGFDGIKLLEGKPTTRKNLALAQNDPLYDAFYAQLEEAGTHVIWHVADPETFWHRETAPAFSLEAGWFYGDGSFLTQEQLYDEVLSVLDRFPKLKVTFAHFFFLSNFPDRAKALLDTYPHVTLDITPGREMYENFSKRPAAWRSFFQAYAQRIVFGTDMARSEFQGAPTDLIGAMTRFLASQDRFDYWGFTLGGLGLSRQAYQLIVQKNFQRLVGDRPRPVDPKAAQAYVERHADAIDDPNLLEALRKAFG